MLYPAPKHLQSLLIADSISSNELELHGTLKCGCGSQTFHLLHVATRVEENGTCFLRVTEIGGRWFCCIGALCTSCGQHHLLFDDHFHGWNGYVCTDEKTKQIARPQFQEWSCRSCESRAHFIALGIMGEGKEFTLEEGEGILTETDWFEAFGWITVDVTCSVCGYGPSRVIDYETM